MGFAVHHKPFVGFTFEWTDGVPDFIVKNLTASAWHRVETGSFQTHKNISNTHSRHAGNIQDLRRGKAMAGDLKSCLDFREEAIVIIDFQIRMNTALHENSRPSQHERFLDFLVDHVVGKNISLWIAFDSVKRAERAELFTHVSVINIAIDDVADDVVRMDALPDSICASPEIEKSSLFKKTPGLF